ncbi:Cadherin-4, partial [Dissostichus eleginoides]
MIRVNVTRKSCVYTLCATRPCHRGTCVAQSPSKFTCHCPEGYRGRHCETTLAIYREDVGLSFSSLFAICICFMALLECSSIPDRHSSNDDFALSSSHLRSTMSLFKLIPGLK